MPSSGQGGCVMSTLFIRDLPPTERPREKLLSQGAWSLSNQELLALLLGTGTATENVLNLATHLLAKAGGLQGLANMSVEELQAVKGIGPAKAAVIQAALQLGLRMLETTRRVGAQIRSPQDVANLLMAEMKQLDREYFRIVLLDTKHRVIDVPIISIGNLNSSIVHPREMFKECIRRSSSAVIMVHNHPSGDPEPSGDDIDVTERIVAAGDLLGITVLDHVIIGDNTFVSFHERGLMGSN